MTDIRMAFLKLGIFDDQPDYSSESACTQVTLHIPSPDYGKLQVLGKYHQRSVENVAVYAIQFVLSELGDLANNIDV